MMRQVGGWVRRFMMAATCVSLAACEATPPDPTVQGTLRVDIAGQLAATFSASGELPVDATGLPTALPQSGAVAVRRGDALTVVGVRKASSGAAEAEVLVLQVGSFTGVGSYTLNVTACPVGTLASCRVGLSASGVSLEQLREAAALGRPPAIGVLIGAGTVTVTEVGGGRIRGTFSGTAAAPPSTGLATVAFSNGQFELPVLVVP